MSKLYTCDKCGSTFPQAIEEEIIKDIHGNWTVYDLCAPCKNKLEAGKEKTRKDFVKSK